MRLKWGEEIIKYFSKPVKKAEEVNEWRWWALFVTAVIMIILFILKILGKIWEEQLNGSSQRWLSGRSKTIF